MIVLDATVMIGVLETTDAHHARAADLVWNNANREFRASHLTLAEALVRPARAEQQKLARTALESLGVVAHPFADDAPERLAILRASTGLPLPDCCVLLAAQDVRGSLATFDDRLSAAATVLGIPLVT